MGVALTVLLLMGLGFCECVFAQSPAETPQAAAIPDLNQVNQTISKYDNFLKAPPAGTPASALREARTRLATAYFLLHRYSESLTVLRALDFSQGKGLPAQAWTVKGLDELELNQLPEAIHTLRRALVANPTSPTARLALGDALARSHRMQEAAQEYQKQADLTPSLVDAWYKLGLAHTQMSVELSDGAARTAEPTVAQQLTAEELIAKGDNLNAARILFRMLHQAPSQPELHAELGAALLALGYSKSAEDHFRRELINNPESPLAHLGLLETSALRDDWSQVDLELKGLGKSHPRELTRLLQFPPAGVVLHAWSDGKMKPPETFANSPSGILWNNWLSDTNLQPRILPAGETGTSQACDEPERKSIKPGVWLPDVCYEKLAARLEAGPALSPRARIKLAEAQFRLGQYHRALATADLLYRLDPASGWGVYWLGKAHDALAEECFVKVGSLNPDSARVHQMLGEHYLKQSEYPQAKAEYLSAIRLAPDQPESHLGLGTVLSRTNDWVEAEKELQTTLRLAPKSDFAHYELGHVYVHEGLWQQAIEHLRLVPGDSTEVLSARLDLATAEAETGQASQAVQDLLSVAELDHDGELYFRLAGLYRTLGDQTRAREALTTFKQLRARSLQADKDELSELEQQEVSESEEPKPKP